MRPTVKKINGNRVLELEQEKEELNNKIAGLKEQLTDPAQDRLSLEEFLNLTVDEEKVASYQLKPPYDVLLKHRQHSLGRGPGN